MLNQLREKALNLPLRPGVYIMQDSAGEVIYVGKAKQLKNRVSSYFHGSHNAKTEAMIAKIADFNVIIASSELEALVLENSLIKHHMPRYNILLKDDKGYPFVRVDLREPYPRFSVVGKMENDGASYFGPYGGRGATFAALDAVRKAVRLPICGKIFPRDIGKERPCLNHHMGLCPAYCSRAASAEEYRQAVNEAVLILSGKTGKLIGNLTEQMERAAENLCFEQAAELRDKIRAIELLKTRQHVLSSALADTDAVGFYRNEAKSCFVVLHYVGGQLLCKDFELLENPMEEDAEAVSQLIRQYYIHRGAAPKNIYLSWELPDREELMQLLSEQYGHSVSIAVPKRGEKTRLILAANENALDETRRATTREERISKTAEWLQKAMGLKKIPERIEAFDISNTGNDDITASMTVFVRGKPMKRAYRKFKIQSTHQQNDYQSMTEAVLRRFRRLQENDEKFSDWPDLLLIDGGSAHAAAVQSALETLGIDVPIFGMVKDERHRTRALVTAEGEEIGIAANPAVFAFIGTIQEETHRFAIEYHRNLRSKRTHASRLDEISGVGPNRKAALLKHFKSLKAIAEASAEELSRVVPRNTADAIYAYFHRENKE